MNIAGMGAMRRHAGAIAVAAVMTATALVTPTAALAATASSGSITFQAANEGSFDQFVVTFPEATAPVLSASDSDSGPIWAGSGKPVDMPGNHFIYLTGSGTNDPLAGSNPATYSLPNIKSAVLYDDFEGSIGIAIGLDHAASYTVSTSGNEVTVDVSH